MEIITDNYNNISIDQLYSKLSVKYAQLDKIDQEESLSKVQKTDYIDSSSAPKNYDEKDFERVLEKFKKADADIRSHEQAHATIGQTTSPISYNYQQGLDGKIYAVGGHVRLDVSLPEDPKAAVYKLDQIKKATTSVADPSGADLAIANSANLNKLLLQSRGEENAG
ncbi:MAG: putative metalloprotease CJM1_0395 family protein [Campylobacterota bacterium]|nr:putative metalloprotease CJM1_0395 family protein [Campylobacterota bacterium]